MSTESKPPERRRFRRIAMRVAVRYAPRQYGSDVPPDLWEAHTVDISRSGVALEIVHRLRRGGTVELTFIQNSPPRCINVVGEVVRCERIPGASAVGTDGSPGGPVYRVAIQFSRILDMEEIALLRGDQPLDATQVEKRNGE